MDNRWHCAGHESGLLSIVLYLHTAKKRKIISFCPGRSHLVQFFNIYSREFG